MNARGVLAAGVLAGTVIGAGIFSLPYVVGVVGVGTGFFYLLVFASVYYLIHRMYAELLLKARGDHEFFTLARTYLPAPWSSLAASGVFAELLFVLLVYLILAPTFAALLIPGVPTAALLVFWAVSSIFIFFRPTWQGVAEIGGTALILAIVVAVFWVGRSAPLEVPLLKPLSWGAFFLPFGPLLFSLSGRPAVHQLVALYRRGAGEGRPFSLPRAIAWGSILPAGIYALFVVGVLRLNPAVTPTALESLTFLSPSLLAALGAMGLLALWTSYFEIGANVRDILRLDLRAPRWIAALVVLFAPLLLYAVGLRDFLGVVSFTGSVFLALEGLAVSAMWRRAFPNHPQRWLGVLLAPVFLIALGYGVVRFVLI